MSKKHIPIFFACDDAYLPPLAVCLQSISDNSSDEYVYDVRVLTSSSMGERWKALASWDLKNLTLSVISVNERIRQMRGKLESRLRDYYSESIYYRIFIPSLFPELDRALYIDCDTVLVDDIAGLYFTEMDGALLAAVPDESIPYVPEFCEYTERWVGVPPEKYFNSGVLVMNLEAMRRERIEERILETMNEYNFETVAPDQDYLNFFCRGAVSYLGAGWNKQPKESDLSREDLHLIHYNMFWKPWHYEGVLYEDEFWRYASRTPCYEILLDMKKYYTEYDKEMDRIKAQRLVMSAAALAEREGGFAGTLGKEACCV